MKNKNLGLIFIALLFDGCSGWKSTLVSKGNQNQVIKNAIKDFLHHGRFYKKDIVFKISVKNINAEILGVQILAANNKVAVITEDEVNYSYKAFPNNFVIEHSILFYWDDSTKMESLDLIDKLRKLNLIDTAIIGKYLPLRVSSETQKSAQYFFCRGDFRNYKLVYTSRGMGTYETPDIYCNVK